MSEKTCSKCGRTFPATAEWFHRNASKKNGLSSNCKECRREYTRRWNEANPDYQRLYYKVHPEKQLERSRRWNEANRECRRRWREANPDKLREYRRRAYLKWKAKRAEQQEAGGDV